VRALGPNHWALGVTLLEPPVAGPNVSPDEARWTLDGGPIGKNAVHVRPITPEDAPALREFHDGLSAETVRLRFFTPHPHLTEAELTRFTVVDHDDREALVAVLNGHIIAVGRYDRFDRPDVAEVAFVVADAHQGRGIGTLLLEYLAAAARSRGIGQFVAETLYENREMMAVFQNVGFAEQTHTDHGVITVRLDLRDVSGAMHAMEQRDWAATVKSVERVLRPRSIALIGAGRDPHSIGHAVLRNLVRGGFTGPVYPVNPRATELEGLRSYPDLSSISDNIDLAVIALPSAEVPDAVDACAQRGVHGLVIVSSGFADAGSDGQALQRRIVERARGGGMRLVGPNCVGVINTEPAVSMNASFAPTPPRRGRIAFASQSGALGIALLERAAAAGLGLSSFVSMGNKADISSNDLLRYWGQDPGTDVILLYLESFGNPRAFSRIARRVAGSKPVIALKGGRTMAGSRAAASHTAAMASPDAVVDALFDQTGVIRVDTIEELFDTAAVLAEQPLPAGARVAVLGNAGGAEIVATDALVEAGLEVRELRDTTAVAIRRLWPASASTFNPVDLGGGARAETLVASLRVLLEADEVDSVLVVVAPVPHIDLAALVEAMHEETQNARIPVVVTLLGTNAPLMDLREGQRRLPCFAFPEPGARALARATAYVQRQSRARGSLREFSDIDLPAARVRIAKALSRTPEGKWLDPDELAQLLACFGINVVPGLVVHSAGAALTAAHKLGFPVVLKAVGKTLVHKSDSGGVALSLASPGAVRSAHKAMTRRLGDAMEAALVQPMAQPGVEMIVGLTHDPSFGPLVMAGMGGTAAELLGDRAFHVTPLTDVDASRLVASLRGAPLLHGYRGAKTVDVASLEELLLRVARLADDVPEVVELDLNPVIVTAEGSTVVDARVRVVPCGPTAEFAVRRLPAAGPVVE
jgi:acetyl coenzyme A synthetase (ADP forming)-like protein